MSNNANERPLELTDLGKDYDFKIQTQQLINQRENDAYKGNRLENLQTDRQKDEEEEARNSRFGFVTIPFWRVS